MGKAMQGPKTLYRTMKTAKEVTKFGNAGNSKFTTLPKHGCPANTKKK